METENQTLYLTNNKSQQKHHLNSFHIFEPDYFIHSAFTLTDSEQRNTSKLLEQPFDLTPIQPSNVLVEQSKENLRGKSIKGNDLVDSAIKIKKTAIPSIENIVIEYQKNQNQSNLLKGLVFNRIGDILNNKPQFSSIEIKTTHLAKEIGHIRKPSSLQSQSFQEVVCESNEDLGEKINSISINYVQKQIQNKKALALAQADRLPVSPKQLFKQIQENKKTNSKLQKINEFLKNYSKNKRQSYAKQPQKDIDWSIVRTMIEKELKCCVSS